MAKSVFSASYRFYLNLGYSPIARFAGENGRSTWPSEWSNYCERPADAATLRRWANVPNANIALACGFAGLVAIDADTDNKKALAACLEALPHCRIGRFGSKGFALLCRHDAGPERFSHIYTGEGKDKRPFIEIKGLGQNITIPPSIHAKTGQIYFWFNPESGEAFDERPAMADLPVITGDHLAALREAMTPWASKPRPILQPDPSFDPRTIGDDRYSKWFAAGLDSETQALAGLSTGRPTALFRAVCKLGAGVHQGYLAASHFENAFVQACITNGLLKREGKHAIVSSIRSGLRASLGDALPALTDRPKTKAATPKPRANGKAHHANGAAGAPVAVNGVTAPNATMTPANATMTASGATPPTPPPAASPPEPPQTPEDPRPIIHIEGGSLSRNATEAEKILFDANAALYRQGGYLVRPVRNTLRDNRGEEVHVPGIAEATAVTIRGAINVYARCLRYDRREKDWLDCDPKTELADMVRDRRGEGPYWRTLAGVSTTPILRRDASIAYDAGYDAATGVYLLDPVALPEMPERPCMDDAMASLALLESLLEEFPFHDGAHPDLPPKRTASYAVALSALLTPIARSAIAVAPMHIAKAPAAGTGKSYLFNVATAIAHGTRCPVIAAGADEEETEKRLAARLIAGSSIVCLDNVNGTLAGDLLCQAITEDIVAPRVLGKSENPNLTNRFTIFATGNNIQTKGDLNRRTICCTLDAGMETPSERPFAKDPVAIVLGDRGRYVAACLTILRAHALEGFPGLAGPPDADGREDAKLKPFNSFEDWSRVVRASLVWLGVPDPVASLEALRTEDPQRMARAAFISAFYRLFGEGESNAKTAAEIVEGAFRGDVENWNQDQKQMVWVLQEHCANKKSEVSTYLVGSFLRKFKDMVLSGIDIGFGEMADLRLTGISEHKPMTEWHIDRLKAKG
jgi:putative DNA primase/helicase